MKLNATMSVAEFKQIVKNDYMSEIEVYTSKNNVAGENRKIKALCSKDNINWPLDIKADSIQDLISLIKKKTGLILTEIKKSSKSSSSDGSNLTNNKKIRIKLSGRIPKYFFGKLNPKIKSEAQKIIDNSGEKIDNMKDFLSLFIAMGMENADMAIIDFKSRISEFDAMQKNCPELFKIFRQLDSKGVGYINLYEQLFDWPENWEGGNAYLSFFEDDARISVLVDNISLINEIPLKEFAQTDYSFDMSEDAENDNEKKLDKWLRTFLKKNKKEFGLGDEIGAAVNSHGAKFMELWFSPPALVKISSKEDAVIIDHDDIIDYTYNFEDADFSFEKLAFLAHANYADFRNSACPTIANFVFYDNKILIPEENLYRDKGITLDYEPDSLTRLDFLIEG